MPYTRRQTRYLLLDGSPLSGKQKAKIKRELHANPEMGHMKKGAKHKGPVNRYAAMSR